MRDTATLAEQLASLSAPLKKLAIIAHKCPQRCEQPPDVLPPMVAAGLSESSHSPTKTEQPVFVLRLRRTRTDMPRACMKAVSTSMPAWRHCINAMPHQLAGVQASPPQHCRCQCKVFVASNSPKLPMDA